MDIKDKAVDLTGLKPWDLIDIDYAAEEFSADVIPEAGEFDVSTYDKYVGARVDMSRGGEKAKGKVVCRVTDEMGHLKGHYHPKWAFRSDSVL